MLLSAGGTRAAQPGPLLTRPIPARGDLPLIGLGSLGLLLMTSVHSETAPKPLSAVLYGTGAGGMKSSVQGGSIDFTIRAWSKSAHLYSGYPFQCKVFQIPLHFFVKPLRIPQRQRSN